jgi:hypothetical protein
MDPEEALNAVTEFLPDFLAWADNPQHNGAQALYERGSQMIEDSYMGSVDMDGPDAPLEKLETQMVAAEVALVIGACAEWIIQDRKDREATS